MDDMRTAVLLTGEEFRAEFERWLAFALNLALEIEDAIDDEFMLYGNERFQTPRGSMEA